MSVKVMAAVFDRYPVGGGEFTLALALADHAHDDGRKVFPFVASLALKTRQSERTVQYQLRKMQVAGWLIAVGAGDGGRGKAREYRISAEWLAGEALQAPAALEKGAEIAPFVEPDPPPERVQSDAQKGATAVAPAIEPQEPSSLPPNPPRGAKGPSTKSQSRTPKPLQTLQAWLAQCEQLGEKPIPPDDSVFAYCATVGIGNDVLALHWREFKARRLAGKKRQADWRATFRDSVRDNWYRLWFLKPGFAAQLTTTGQQAQALLRAELAERAIEEASA